MKFSIIHKTVFLTMIMAGMESYGQELENFKWKNRILIVKTLDSDSEIFNDQLTEFRDSNDEFEERKLVLLTMNQNDFELINFTRVESGNSGQVSDSISDNILNQSNDFEVILIGLDGGIKLRRSTILLKKDLFSIIDAMPMRRNEMRN